MRFERLKELCDKVGGLNDRLAFDGESHTYRYDGSIYPGVTSVISGLIDYSMVKEEMLRLAAERGSYVHLATELHDKGELDESSVDPALRGYFDAWLKFRDDKMAKPLAVERQLFHPLHRYCCTLDRTMVFGNSDAVELVEIKTTSQLMPATGPQLVGQQLAWEANNGPRISARHAVQLRSNGTYRFKTYEDPDDLPVFMACLTTRRWLHKHK